MITAILVAILLPAGITSVFAIMEKQSNRVSSKMTDKNFTVMIPNMILFIGAGIALMTLAAMVSFVFLRPDAPFYTKLGIQCFLGLFLYLGVYWVIKTLTFRVVVQDEWITVYPTMRKPYSFTFSEIASALRQVKNNEVKSERIVIKTTTGRKLIVERAEISYRRFAKRIQEEVPQSRLVGFEGQNKSQ